MKTKTWRREEAAVEKAKRQLRKCKSTYAKIIQRKKAYAADMNDNKAKIEAIERDRDYYQKVDKKTKEKHLVKRNKPKQLSTAEAKRLKKAQENYADSKKKHAAIQKSKTYRHAKSRIDKATKKYQIAKSKRDKYIRKVHKAHAKKINQQKIKNTHLSLAPHASLHQTDNGSAKQVFLFATSEDETNDDEVTSYSIDASAPTADHVKRSGKSITITAFLYGPNFANGFWKKSKNLTGESRKSIDQQYADLLAWNRHGVELTYKSASNEHVKGMNHMYFKHVYITSLSKLLDAPLKDSMQISLTLTYLYRAKVKTVKNSKGQRSRRGHYVGANVVTLNHGQTAAQLAKKYHTTTRAIEKMNHGHYAFPQGTKVKVSPGIKATKTKTGIKYSGFNRNTETSDKVRRILRHMNRK